MTDTQNDTSELREQIEQLQINSPDGHQFTEDVLALIAQREQAAELRVRKEERSKARQLYAKRNPQYTRQWIADYLGISRPTLNKWLQDPELFTLGAVRRLATLQATNPEKDEL